MKPTEELRTRLRRMLDERIPEGGVDSDTRFKDEELNDLIEWSNTIFGAAEQGWLEKAGMCQREMGDVEETKTGQESYKLIRLKDRLSYAFAMAARFAKMDEEETSKSGMGSVIVALQPDVGDWKK